MNPTGTGLVYSTYFGGAGDDEAHGVALDDAGAVYMTGQTSSTNLWAQDPAQPANGGSDDAFVAKIGDRQISTVAGDGYAGFSGDNGPARQAMLNTAAAVAIDSAGNLFIADTGNNRVREVVAATGLISTVAGTGAVGYSGDGGAATAATLNLYNTGGDVAVDGAGNLFIADTGNNVVREVVAATGVISTVAGTGVGGFGGDGGPATAAALQHPYNVVVDSAGDLFIADTANNRVREVIAASGVITTVAGTGTAGYTGDGGLATTAQLSGPHGLAVDGQGNIYVDDQGNNRVREVLASTGTILTLAGTGTAGYGGDGGLASAAQLNAAGGGGLAVDGQGDLFIADSGNNRVREVYASTGLIDTVAGTGTTGYGGDGGPATAATLYAPAGLALDARGTLAIADTDNSVVRQIGGLASPRHGATGTIPWHAHQSMSLGGALALSVDLSDGHLDASATDMAIPGRGPDLTVRVSTPPWPAAAGSPT